MHGGARNTDSRQLDVQPSCQSAECPPLAFRPMRGSSTKNPLASTMPRSRSACTITADWGAVTTGERSENQVSLTGRSFT